jgi:hypothetical protein
LLLPLPVSSAGLQQDVDPFVPYNPWVALFPALQRLPAPEWIGEGLRVTYYSQSATMDLDPEEPAPAGAGYIQYDVVGQDRRGVAQFVTFLLDSGNGVIQPSLAWGSVAIPAVGDFWINPDVLADAEDAATEDLSITRMPYEIGETTFDAVRFEYETPRATYVWVFDRETGLQLFYRHEIGRGAGRQLADMTLVKVRTLELPWNPGVAPTWVKRGLTLEYEGGNTTVVMGSDPVTFPIGATIRVDRSQRRYTRYALGSSFAGRQEGAVDSVSGAAQPFNALWLPEDALNFDPDDSLIDEDPVTGVRLTFERIGQNHIVMSQSTKGYVQNLVYDARNGQLYAIHQETQVGLATIIIDLNRVE